jgi:hypothetical protein
MVAIVAYACNKMHNDYGYSDYISTINDPSDKLNREIEWCYIAIENVDTPLDYVEHEDPMDDIAEVWIDYNITKRMTIRDIYSRLDSLEHELDMWEEQ